MQVPLSTYRLQFHAGFTFRQAAAMTPYLARLGITHAYASPYFKAVAGSLHGYDVVDHNELNPELGGRHEFERWVGVLRKAGMSHILDIVPNHVGVATNDNAWWNHVLENGPSSPYGRFFDIDWENCARPALQGTLLLPVLGESYGKCLEKGELRLSFIAREFRFFVNYYQRRFPIESASSVMILQYNAEALGRVPEAEREEYDRLVAALGRVPAFMTTEPREIDRRQQEVSGLRRRLATLLKRSAALRLFIRRNVTRFNGTPGEPRSFDLLDRLLCSQPYRLSCWRNAADEINYRRFFDINGLAALAIEREEVFRRAHQMVFAMLEAGEVSGLRVDHPDGLYDPEAYLARLQAGVKREGGGEATPVYAVVEKILGLDEELRDWPVAGTSGYDFLNQVNLLFVDSASEEAFSRLYQEVTGDGRTFAEIVHEKKLMVLDRSFAGELHRLTGQLVSLAQEERQGKDFSLRCLEEALRQTITCFAVYRSYVTSAELEPADRREIENATAEAAKRVSAGRAAACEFLRDVLLQRYPESLEAEQRGTWLRFAARFQQLTAPVTAKGVEDTAFYNYHRLISLNEVGGDPAQFGAAPERLHAYFARRQEKWSGGLSVLSTHDTKRSEDVRARLNVLACMPAEWRQHVLYWREVNAGLRRRGGEKAAAPEEEYLLYQTLAGAWPMEPQPAAPPAFVERMQGYMVKAMREAKQRTSWTEPDEAHETAVKEFVAAVLDVSSGEAFLADFLPFVWRLSEFGMTNSLAQTTLRLMAPGVPDTYQGTELWDLSLVDPDNRRLVDYTARATTLDAIIGRIEAGELEGLVGELMQQRRDGRVKLYLLWRLLNERRTQPELFGRGEYLPCRVTGPRRQNVFAFVRITETQAALVVVPRFTAAFLPEGMPIAASAWEDTAVEIPAAASMKLHRNVLTDEAAPSGDSLPVAKLLGRFPVAVLR